ncbi:MAG: hypothetical protein H6Q16_864 [Bacteroidetes bacterium]|nr:hypothetical protein [Bacteroidota bacterium]
MYKKLNLILSIFVVSIVFIFSSCDEDSEFADATYGNSPESFISARLCRDNQANYNHCITFSNGRFSDPVFRFPQETLDTTSYTYLKTGDSSATLKTFFIVSDPLYHYKYIYSDVYELIFSTDTSGVYNMTSKRIYIHEDSDTNYYQSEYHGTFLFKVFQ